MQIGHWLQAPTGGTVQPVRRQVGPSVASFRGVPADEVDLINTAARPLGGKREAERSVIFGDHAWTSRSRDEVVTGHMMGAAGSLRRVQQLAEQTVPATINYRDATRTPI